MLLLDRNNQLNKELINIKNEPSIKEIIEFKNTIQNKVEESMNNPLLK
jgi:hypothetical protein